MSTKKTTIQLANPIAAERYKANQEEAQQLIEGLQARLKAHAMAQAANPTDWGYVGDINHVVQKLRELQTPGQ